MTVKCFMFTLTGNCPYGEKNCPGQHILVPKPTIKKSQLKKTQDFNPTVSSKPFNPTKSKLKTEAPSFNFNPSKTPSLRTDQSFTPVSNTTNYINLESQLGDNYMNMATNNNIGMMNNNTNIINPYYNQYNNFNQYGQFNSFNPYMNQQMNYMNSFNNFQPGYSELQQLLESNGYDDDTINEILQTCAECNCCNGDVLNCQNCADGGEESLCNCLMMMEAERNVYDSNNRVFKKQFSNCDCCKGYVDDCNGAVCIDLGTCQCVVRAEMEDEEEDVIEMIEECKDCNCCKGRVYECPKKLDNCIPGTCGCFR